jgi:hypothetical protein
LLKFFRPVLDKLLGVGVVGYVWHLIGSMLSNVVRAVMLDGDVSPEFRLSEGVPQGAVLSPILYAIYINGVVQDFNRGGYGVRVGGIKVACLLYADDLVVIAEDPMQLCNMLRCLDTYADLWHFTFNAAKCGIVAIASFDVKQEIALLGLTLSGKVVHLVSSYQYLGTDFDENRTARSRWTRQCTRFINAASEGSNQLLWFAKRSGLLHSSAIATLWTAAVRPQLEYAAGFWSVFLTQADSKRFELVQHAFGSRREAVLRQRTS